MKQDQSYGIVPLQKRATFWQVFLVRHKSGHWTLPKGHPEPNETALESAKRELFEETGLTIQKLLYEDALIEEYQFMSRNVRINKRVDYFIAEVAGVIKIQLEELQEGKWLSFENAQETATYPQMKALLKTVFEMISS